MIFRYTLTLKHSQMISSEEFEPETIVAVCRQWWYLGIESLYNHIIIRCVNNLAALLRTVNASAGSRVGRLVKELVIVCLVMFGDDLTLFEASLEQVIVNCPSLSTLVVGPSFYLVPRDLEVDLRPLRFCHGTLNVTHVEWGCCLLLDDLVSLL